MEYEEILYSEIQLFHELANQCQRRFFARKEMRISVRAGGGGGEVFEERFRVHRIK